MILLELFLSFIWVGSFSIGGGYAAIPFIQSEVVLKHGWLTMKEFTDLITIAEMTPGPITVNSATFVGLRIADIPGALVTTLGVILPSIFIVTFLAFLYYRYQKMSFVQNVLSFLRPAVVALIASAGLSIFMMIAKTNGQIAWMNLILFGGAFFFLRKYKKSPILTMVLCGILYLLLHILLG